MEGFDNAQFNEILGLTKKGLNAAVLVAVGYRSEEDTTQHYKKVRKSKENFDYTYINRNTNTNYLKFRIMKKKCIKYSIGSIYRFNRSCFYSSGQGSKTSKNIRKYRNMERI